MMEAVAPPVRTNPMVTVLLFGQAVQRVQLANGVRVIVAVPLKGALAVPKLDTLEVIAIQGGETALLNEAPRTVSELGVGVPLDIVTQRPPATLEPVQPDAYAIGIAAVVAPVTL
jgi:hypothetical protein